MPTERLAPAAARAMAGELVRDLRAHAPRALELGGVDLGPALEQQLFFALRDGIPAAVAGRARGPGAIDLVRVAGAFGLSLVPRQRPDVGPRPLAAVIRLPARMAILRPIEAALRDLGGGPIRIVRVARAAEAAGAAGAAGGGVRLTDLLSPADLPRVVGFQLGLPGALDSGRLGRELRDVAARELARIALGTAAVESLVRRWRPALLIAFDEVGTWSRILPAVARARGVPSLNLPHAEAADPVAISGADYDRFAVFGPRAAAVLRDAGIAGDRIVQVGAPHFDALIARGASTTSRPTRRIVFAAQYVQGTMTLAGLEACHRAALAAAAAVAPAEILVVPHPVQPAGLIEGIVARTSIPPGVEVNVEHSAGLHDVIDTAWLLVTGWSNSAFEAAIRRVPTLMVDAEHVAPVDYATDGLGIAAPTEAAAAAAARALLDDKFREATLARAGEALAEHLGPLDGRSSERAARLILALAERDPARAA